MKTLWMILSLFAVTTAASADDMMNTVVSKNDFQTTQAKLEAVLKEKGLTTFAKVDHAEGAKAVGMSMQPAIVTIFGNPKGGTPFMVASLQSAIDFPLKALVSQSADGKVSVSYYPVTALVARHGIKGQDELAKKLDGLLGAIAKAATE